MANPVCVCGVWACVCVSGCVCVCVDVISRPTLTTVEEPVTTTTRSMRVVSRWSVPAVKRSTMAVQK